MLVFSAEIESKPPSLAARTEAGYVVEALRIRPAVVVDDGLAKVKAIAQWRARYTVQPGIDTLKLYMRFARPIRPLNIRLKFLLQGMKNRAGFLLVIGILNVVGSLFQHMHDTQPGPWAHSEKGRIGIAKSVQAI